MSLAAPRVHRDDDIALHALIEHFLLIRTKSDTPVLVGAPLVFHCGEMLYRCMLLPCRVVSCCDASLVEGVSSHKQASTVHAALHAGIPLGRIALTRHVSASHIGTRHFLPSRADE